MLTKKSCRNSEMTVGKFCFFVSVNTNVILHCIIRYYINTIHDKKIELFLYAHIIATVRIFLSPTVCNNETVLQACKRYKNFEFTTYNSISLLTSRLLNTINYILLTITIDT